MILTEEQIKADDEQWKARDIKQELYYLGYSVPNRLCVTNDHLRFYAFVTRKALEMVEQLSAQPEKRTEESTETHACDSISRQAAIDVLTKDKASIDRIIKNMSGYEKEFGVLVSQRNQVEFDINAINGLPPAPAPIRCEECEHWKEHYFCKVVFHPTNANDTCATVLDAKRKGER